MKCIYCNCTESRVVDSRPTEDGAIRRRRECEAVSYTHLDVYKRQAELKDKEELLAATTLALQQQQEELDQNRTALTSAQDLSLIHI